MVFRSYDDRATKELRLSRALGASLRCHARELPRLNERTCEVRIAVDEERAKRNGLRGEAARHEAR